MVRHLGRAGPLQRAGIPFLRSRQPAGTEGQRRAVGARLRRRCAGDRYLARRGHGQARRPLANLAGQGRACPGRDHGRDLRPPRAAVGRDRECRHRRRRRQPRRPFHHPQRPAKRGHLRPAAGPRRQRVGGNRARAGAFLGRAPGGVRAGLRLSAGTGVPGVPGCRRTPVRRHRAWRVPAPGRALRACLGVAAGRWRAQHGAGWRRQPVGRQRQQRPVAAGQVRGRDLHQPARVAEQPGGRTAGGSRGQHLGGHQCRPAAPERRAVQHLQRRPRAQRRLRARRAGVARRVAVARHQPRPQPLARWQARGQLHRRQRPAQRLGAEPAGRQRRQPAGRQLHRRGHAPARRQAGRALRQRARHARQQPGARAGAAGGRHPVVRHQPRAGADARRRVHPFRRGPGPAARIHHFAAGRATAACGSAPPTVRRGSWMAACRRWTCAA